MTSLNDCIRNAKLPNDEAASLRAAVRGAGDPVSGVEDYIDGIEDDLEDLRNQLKGFDLARVVMEPPAEPKKPEKWLSARTTSLLRLAGISDDKIEGMTSAERAAEIERLATAAQAVMFDERKPTRDDVVSAGRAFYISTGEKGAKYTLRVLMISPNNGRISDEHVRTLSTDKDDSVKVSRMYAAMSGNTVVYWGAPHKLNEFGQGTGFGGGSALVDRSGEGGTGAPAPIEPRSEPEPSAQPRALTDMTDAEVVNHFGMTIEARTSKAGKNYWSVFGNTLDHKELLDKLGFAPPFKMGGKWLRSKFDSDPTKALADALRGAPITTPAETAPELDREKSGVVLTAAKLNVNNAGGKWTVTGKGTFDHKVILRQLGGKWDGAAKAWTFESDPTGKLAYAVQAGRSGQDAKDDTGTGVDADEELRLRELRLREDGRSDERAETGDPARLVSDETKRLIKVGEKYGIPEDVTREQIEDVGMIVSAHQRKKPVFIVANDAGTGKAQPLDAKILTPSGWKRMGDIRFGDAVIAGDGSVTRVSGVFPQGDKKIFRITFSDGSSTECCDEHLWLTESRQSRSYRSRNKSWPCSQPEVRQLSEIRQSIKARGSWNYTIPMVGVVQFAKRPVGLSGYVMGALLGDGCTRCPGAVSITSGDHEIIEAISAELDGSLYIKPIKVANGRCPSYRIASTLPMKRHQITNTARMEFEKHGLYGLLAHEKFLPDDYKFNDVETRLGALRGLMDTDGWVENEGKSSYFCSTSRRLAEDVAFLVQSLGGVSTIKEKKTSGRPAYNVRVCMPPEINPFRLSRKANAVLPKTKYRPRRHIVSVEDVGIKPAQCISIVHPSKLYVTDDFIVTHNTFVLGGAIRELRAAGEKKFVYVTMSQDLIAQIKRDLTPYGVEDVEFATYAGLSGASAPDTTDAVLIFDEAHNVKNDDGSARGDKAQGMMTKSRMTIISSATPFENPVEARYIQATGLFNQAGGFNDWAKMYGAAVRKRKFYNPHTGKQQVEEIIYWPGRGKKQDGAAARQWFFKQGVMTQRPMKIPRNMSEVQFLRTNIDQKYVDMYDHVQGAYEAALRSYTDQNGKPIDSGIYKDIAMHRENATKRILEASKADFAIERAREHLAAGKNVVIFVETKADRTLGMWRRSAHFKDDTLYTYPQVADMMAEWQREAEAARRMDERPPPRPFADFIVAIARHFHEANVRYDLPSTAEKIQEALASHGVGIYTGGVTAQTATKAKAEFLAGKLKVLIATMAKGGTGLSLHDTKGDRPTVQVNLNLPWKGTGVAQVSGRVARYGLQSKARIEWLFAQNIPWESQKLAPRVGARMRDMGAIVGGIEVPSAEILDGDFNFEGERDAGHGEAGPKKIDADDIESDIFALAERLEATRSKADDTSSGFFETPFPLAALVTQVAGARGRVLEPSAGTGNLLRFMPKDVEITAVELRQDNFEKLKGKAYGNLINADFMEADVGTGFDTIVMNPPFERKEGVGAQDVAHVMKAYDLLADNGRLVAIMGEGAFFRQTKQEAEFRQWLDDVGATVIDIPAGAFKASGTGVKTRMVIVDNTDESGRSDIKLEDTSIQSLKDVADATPPRASDVERIEAQEKQPPVVKRVEPVQPPKEEPKAQPQTLSNSIGARVLVDVTAIRQQIIRPESTDRAGPAGPAARLTRVLETILARTKEQPFIFSAVDGDGFIEISTDPNGEDVVTLKVRPEHIKRVLERAPAVTPPAPPEFARRPNMSDLRLRIAREQAEPVLDLRGNPTGWLKLDQDNSRILIHPTLNEAYEFAGDNTGAGDLRAKMRATAYAIDNPVKAAPIGGGQAPDLEIKSLETGKVSRVAPAEQDTTYHYTDGDMGMTSGGSFTKDRARWMTFDLAEAERMNAAGVRPYGATRDGLFVGTTSGRRLTAATSKAAEPAAPEQSMASITDTIDKQTKEFNDRLALNRAGADRIGADLGMKFNNTGGEHAYFITHAGDGGLKKSVKLRPTAEGYRITSTSETMARGQRESIPGPVVVVTTEAEAMAAVESAMQGLAIPKKAAEEARAQPATANVEDVGENLKFNRRNFTNRGLTWDDIKAMNPALRKREAVKQKIWPKPDYEKMVEDGMNPLVARAVKQVYDGIAREPAAQTDEALQLFADTITKVREAVFAWGSDSDRLREWADGMKAAVQKRMGASRGGRISLMSMATESENYDSRFLIKALWPEEMEKSRVGQFGRGTPALEELRALGGNKAFQAFQITIDDLVSFTKEITEEGWPTPREAWQRQGYEVVETKPVARVVEGTLYGGSRDARVTKKVYRIFLGTGWKAPYLRTEYETNEEATAALADLKPWALTRGDRVIGTFDSRDAAVEAAREATKRKATEGGDIRGMNLSDSERTGPPRRAEGENKSSQDLKDAFGFRGVNFGRKSYMNDTERQVAINAAYDALHDLSEILGVPPKALSMDGMLGIAFGAQGRGSSAAAHFVPGMNEINLTKTMGAGTLAHEWGHALDHYFAVQAGLASKDEPYMSGNRGVAGDVRPEIRAAFDAVIDAMKKRQMTEAEFRQQMEAATEKSRGHVKAWLKHIRSGFAVDLNNQGDEVDIDKDDVLKRFDAIAETILNGEGLVNDNRVYVGRLALLRPVAEIRAIVQSAIERGRSSIDISDNWKGLDNNAGFLKARLERNAASIEHIPQTKTDYLKASEAADAKKKGKIYWSTSREMFARAFELYVSDRLTALEQRNTFLSDADIRETRIDERTKEKVFPYPREGERGTINDAIDKLVKTIKTKETPQGVAMFGGLRRGAQRQPLAIINQGGQWRILVDGEYLAGPAFKTKPEAVQWSLDNKDMLPSKKPAMFGGLRRVVDGFKEAGFRREISLSPTALKSFAYHSPYRPLGSESRLFRELGAKYADNKADQVSFDKPLSLDDIERFELVPISPSARLAFIKADYAAHPDAKPNRWVFRKRDSDTGFGAMVTRESTGEGKWRVTTFDAYGFSGHEVYDTEDQAISAANFAGMEPAPTHLKDMMESGTFKGADNGRFAGLRRVQPDTKTLPDFVYRAISSDNPDGGQELRGAADLEANGDIVAYHVTDDPMRVQRALSEGIDLAEGRDTDKFGDLGRGLYGSARPQMWQGRSAGKWDFMDRLTADERQRLYDAMENHPNLRESGYLTADEIARAKRSIELARQRDNPQLLSNLADQPYNMNFSRPDFLESIGIKPGTQPKTIEMRLRGRFADLKRNISQSESDALRALGFDGAFTGGSMGTTPQIVVWNRDAVTSWNGVPQARPKYAGLRPATEKVTVFDENDQPVQVDQFVVPGAERTADQQAQAARDRQRAELELRAKQSKMRTGKAQEEPGGLFGDKPKQGSLFGGLRRGGVIRTDEHGKNIVWERGDYFIAVDTPRDAKYVTLWKNGKRIGALSTRTLPGKPDWTGVESIEINKSERGLGLGREMYRQLLAHTNPAKAGIASYLPDQANKKQVPAIYRRLGGYTEGDYAFIPLPKEMFGGLRRPRIEPSLGDMSGQASAMLDDLIARLRQMDPTGKVGLVITRAIERMVDGDLYVSDGMYLDKLITIALNAASKGKTLDHEIIHAFRDLGLIRPAEWAALTRLVKSDIRRVLPADDEAQYRAEYTRQGATNVDELILEEAVANLHAMWRVGEIDLKGFPKTAMQRIQDFFRILYEVLTGRGFNTPESIFERIGSGALGRRESGDMLRATPQFAAAWHGTPHDFDRFDINKIDTGEGAQAYGHGLYFAGNREVAEFYKKKLGNKLVPYLNGKAVQRDSFLGQAILNYHAILGTKGKYLKETYTPEMSKRVVLNDLRHRVDYERLRGNEAIAKEAEDAASAFDAAESHEARKDTGKLLKVELAPAEDEYLLWDERMDRQSAKVIAALNKQIDTDAARGRQTPAGEWFSTAVNRRPGTTMGGTLYEKLARILGGERMLGPSDKQYGPVEYSDDKAASQLLRALGIRGIKYLDQGSRDKGEGTYNYVIFDDADVKITEKFGGLRKAGPAPVFFSALTRGIESHPQTKGPASQWAGIIDKMPGVKAEEVAWSGVKEWLADQTGPVTREALADFLRANEVKVEEVVRGGAAPTELDAIDAQIRELSNWPAQPQTARRPEDQARLDEIMRQWEVVSARTPSRDYEATKFAGYVLPGGESYRELLLTLPARSSFVPTPPPEKLTKLPDGWYPIHDASPRFKGKEWGVVPAGQKHARPYNDMQFETKEEAIAAAVSHLNEVASLKHARDEQERRDEDAARNNFTGGHFPEPNVVAHIRFNERTDADGRRTLFLEEIQSDFGQKTRKAKAAIEKAIDGDFNGIIGRMKKAGVLQVECD